MYIICKQFLVCTATRRSHLSSICCFSHEMIHSKRIRIDFILCIDIFNCSFILPANWKLRNSFTTHAFNWRSLKKKNCDRFFFPFATKECNVPIEINSLFQENKKKICEYVSYQPSKIFSLQQTEQKNAWTLKQIENSWIQA